MISRGDSIEFGDMVITWAWFSRWLMAVLLVDLGISQYSEDQNTNTNTFIRVYCGRYGTMSSSIFSANLNSTVSQLRRQLENNGMYYARTQSLQNGGSVYGIAQCRNYVSTSQCLACFDAALSAVFNCSFVNGVNVFLDDCFFSLSENGYNYDEFYDDPRIIEQVGVIPIGICGNQSASQPITTFNQTVNELLSDIHVATPKTSNFYVASTRKLSGGNATVYAIAQCVQNMNADVCQNCLNRAYNNLHGCLPNSEGRSIDIGCFMRYSDIPFFNDNQTTNIASFLSEGTSSKIGMIVGISGGAGLFLLILALSLWFRLWKKSKDVGARDTLDASQLQGGNVYNYKDLQLATDNFSEVYRVGKGGFGEVFKAIMDDGNIVAVKKLGVEYSRAKTDFENEVKLISNVRHRNLLPLLGWSTNGTELLLVLEYMPSGSLDKYLWGDRKGSLNWKQRFDIIFGIAKGLVHLHNEFNVKIIHRDIKSSNILLDDDFQPKIADFGLARFQPDDQTHVVTQFAGTLGYTAPEYAKHGHLSDKVDTYSFGIVVLEIVSGRKCSDTKFNGRDATYLLEHAWQLYEKGRHSTLIDEALDPNEYQQQHITKTIEIALTCTQSPVTLRPTMFEVVLMLSSGLSLGQRQITRPTFIDPSRRIHIGDNTLNKN